MEDQKILWDVYNSPRLDPVQFGRYFAAEDASRDGILTLAKYCPRTHRASGRQARDVIRKYATSAVPNAAVLEAARDKFKGQLTDPTRTDEQHADDLVNLRNIEGFLAFWNQEKAAGKDLILLSSDQTPMDVGGLEVRLALDFLIAGHSKDGAPTVGGAFLNTQKGDGLGKKPETIARRSKAGEALAILVLRRVTNEHSDHGLPAYADCWHFYIQQKHVWRAPKNFSNKLKNIEASGRSVVEKWPGVDEPTNFDPALAKFHS